MTVWRWPSRRDSVRDSRPQRPPSTGRKISATINEADSTKIRVIGNCSMNLPGIPGQSSMGRKAQSVVAVEATMGQNIRRAALA